MGDSSDFGADDVAWGDVVGLVGEADGARPADGLRRDEEADGYVGDGREFEAGGVADGEGAGWDGDGGASAEGECAGGGEVDVRCRWCGARCCAAPMVQGIEAELVGEDDADARDRRERRGRSRGRVVLGRRRTCLRMFGIATGEVAQVPTQWSGGAATALLRQAEEAEEREGSSGRALLLRFHDRPEVDRFDA